MDRELLEMLTVVQSIISVIVLIVFFVIAKNVSALKKHLTPDMSYSKLLLLAKKEAFKGNIGKASDLHHEAAYKIIYHSDMAFNTKAKEVAERARDISDIGGNVSKNLIDYIEKHPVKEVEGKTNNWYS